MSPSGKSVALVSGALGGIASDVIPALREDGFAVVGVDERSGPSGADLDFVCDVTDSNACEAVVSKTLRAYGRLDTLVHAAGIYHREAFANVDIGAARAVFDVNVWGTVNLTLAAASALSASGRGAVVVVTSINGERGYVGGSIYGMTKAALGALVRTLAVEWGPHSIRVNAVAPALVPTSMNAELRESAGFVKRKIQGIPLGRMISTNEVAEAVAFLGGQRGGGISGVTLPVDGGATARGA